MRRFLLRLLGADHAAKPRWLDPIENALSCTARAADVDALAEAVQKTARAQAKLSLKLDDIEGKLEAGLDDLRRVRTATPAGPDVDAVLDAMDLLEQAERTARREGSAALADGIAGIGRRLGGFVEQQGLSRKGSVGEMVEARWFKVVGTEPAPLPPGAITRVVRAAVLAGDAMVREGEAIVAAEEQLP